MGRFARQLARRLHHDGHPWPDLAAALITARGTAGLDTAAFARQLGLPPALLAQLEDGTLTNSSSRTASPLPAPFAMADPPAAGSSPGTDLGASLPVTARPLLSPRFTDALTRACTWHATQKRKKDHVDIPYVAHLLGAAALVLDDGGSEDEAIAALLHDAVEDQDVTAERVAGLYGDEVARIVDACSDTAGRMGEKKPPWRERKEHHLAKLQALGADGHVLRVTAADKLHNCRDIVADLRQQGPERLNGFNGGIAGTCWYYRQMAALLVANLPASRITQDLQREVALLHQLAGVELTAPRDRRGRLPTG